MANDHYEMFNDNDADDPPLFELPNVPRPKKAIYSDKTLYEWKTKSRDRYLLEFLRMDGCGDASETLCPGCKGEDARPGYRCRDCKGGLLYCRDCFVNRHRVNPLHRFEAWTGVRFVKTCLKALGLRIQFGHPPGEPCGNPQPGRSKFVVLDTNSIQDVAVDYCGCENRGNAGAPYIQLLRGSWFPASENRPQTCMTIVGLEQFHTEALQAKITMYNFYKTLEKLTCNDGSKPWDRYQVFIWICREYRDIMMLKRAGLGHHPDVLCPACPRPGVNLDEDWKNASKEDKFLYILFLALDACFWMKRGLVSSELKDPGLSTGLRYMVENDPYRKYLLTMTDQMSTCSGLAVLDYANTRFSRGYSTTGMGMVVCARHEFIQPNGVGDLQKGERYANMDYIFASVLHHLNPLLLKIIGYNIVCQWWKQLMERLAQLPVLVRYILILPLIAFVIPKMHIHAHTSCARPYIP
ncbi:hypothetical protein B0H19DRAFT_1208943 [Mycena capillaripes]|nr:hypothetical protein B0H19DRAFT_1208943 [Mycena capillaripes]